MMVMMMMKLPTKTTLLMKCASWALGHPSSKAAAQGPEASLTPLYSTMCAQGSVRLGTARWSVSRSPAIVCVRSER
jgi:hypothetical protein